MAHDLPPGILHCTPALPNFCANIHVGCAGRSRLKTSAFDVVFHKGRASVTFANGTGWAAAVSGSGRNTLLRQTGTQSWIRVESDLRFSQRMYRKGEALMAYGTCVAANPA